MLSQHANLPSNNKRAPRATRRGNCGTARGSSPSEEKPSPEKKGLAPLAGGERWGRVSGREIGLWITRTPHLLRGRVRPPLVASRGAACPQSGCQVALRLPLDFRSQHQGRCTGKSKEDTESISSTGGRRQVWSPTLPQSRRKCNAVAAHRGTLSRVPKAPRRICFRCSMSVILSYVF